MSAFSLAELLAARRGSGRLYEELVRVPALSVGVYEVPAGGVDPQVPHGEDEVYVAVRGRAKATTGGDTVDVAPGAVLYVPAGVPHRFHDIEEDLTVVVVFAPAEGSTGVPARQ